MISGKNGLPLRLIEVPVTRALMMGLRSDSLKIFCTKAKRSGETLSATQSTKNTSPLFNGKW